MDDVQFDIYFGHLSTRTRTVLKKNNIDTPEKASSLSDEEYYLLPGCGSVALTEIRQYFPYKPLENPKLGDILESRIFNPESFARLLANIYTRQQYVQLLIEMLKRLSPPE
jgi:hypothetical protein